MSKFSQFTQFVGESFEKTKNYVKENPYLIYAGCYLLSKTVNVCIKAIKNYTYANTVVEVHLNGVQFCEAPINPAFRAFEPKTQMFLQLLRTLDTAATLPKVAAVVFHLGDNNLGFAQIQELRAAIAKLRANGKLTIAYAETIGEFAVARSQYYLATACDKVVMAPSGTVGLVGLMMMASFVRHTLQKLDVEPLLVQRRQYKSAANTFTETDFTEAHREMFTHLHDGILKQLVSDIAKDRNLDEEKVMMALKEGPYQGPTSLERGLVDALVYPEVFYKQWLPTTLATHLKRPAGSKVEPRLLYWNVLATRFPPPTSGTKVAVIVAEGTIHRGQSQRNGWSGRYESVGSDTLSVAFRQAIEDKQVKAIVLRVNSPGGSYVASDLIDQMVLLAKSEGKKVVVSMSNVAASGGYFISQHADRVLAMPGTLTGSIGVFCGKFNMRGLWAKMGVTFDDIKTSDNAELFSSVHSYTQANQDSINKFADEIYGDFVRKVADGRRMQLDEAENVAKGRVWLGQVCVENRLVDQHGGYLAALDAVRELLQLPATSKLACVAYPIAPTFWAALFKEQPTNSRQLAAVSAHPMLDGHGWSHMIGTLSRMNLISSRLCSLLPTSLLADPRLESHRTEQFLTLDPSIVAASNLVDPEISMA